MNFIGFNMLFVVVCIDSYILFVYVRNCVLYVFVFICFVVKVNDVC